MSAVESLRNVIKERLTAAAEEILGAFVTTISVYEEEISRQRRLLDVFVKPETHQSTTGVDSPDAHRTSKCFYCFQHCHINQVSIESDDTAYLHAWPDTRN